MTSGRAVRCVCARFGVDRALGSSAIPVHGCYLVPHGIELVRDCDNPHENAHSAREEAGAMVSFTVLVQVIDECAVGTDLLAAQNQAPVPSAHTRRERLLRRLIDELDVLRQYSAPER